MFYCLFHEISIHIGLEYGWSKHIAIEYDYWFIRSVVVVVYVTQELIFVSHLNWYLDLTNMASVHMNLISNEIYTKISIFVW